MIVMQRLALLIVLLSLLACAPAPASRQAAVEPDEESGIGGTGMLADSAPIAVIGKVTGFGSIFVNGVEIEFDSATSIFMDEEKTASHRFAIGEVVEALAVPEGRIYRAREIRLRHEIEGPVQSVDTGRRSCTILNQLVVMSSDVLTLPAPGQFLQVSGFRDSKQRIHATAWRVAPHAGPVSIRGVLAPAGQGRFSLGKLLIDTGHLGGHPSATAGALVRVVGDLRSGVLFARHLTSIVALPFTDRTGHWLVQDFLATGENIPPRLVSFPMARPAPQLLRQLSGQPEMLVRAEIRSIRESGPVLIRLNDLRALPAGRPNVSSPPPQAPPHDTMFRAPTNFHNGGGRR